VIYLIGEIVLYLLAALLLGGGAGWLLRDTRVRASVETAAEPQTAVESSAAPVPAADAARIADLEAALAEARRQAAEWQGQLAAREADAESLTRRMSALSRQVEELQRERALQTRALQVLHQQLELAIERGEARHARANGTAA